MAAPYRFGAGRAKPKRSASSARNSCGSCIKNARPVAGRFVGPGGPPVHQVQQHLLAVFHDGMIADARYVDDGADAAGVVFPLWLVQPSGLGGARHKLIATARRWSQKFFWKEAVGEKQRLCPVRSHTRGTHHIVSLERLMSMGRQN